LEKLIRKDWVIYFEKHELLAEKQFSFRSGKSFVTNLLSFYGRVSEIMQESERWINSVYLDFKKTFDRVSHQRFTWKLENRGGIKGQFMKWMKNFLS